jgi:hypothetical protein
MVKRKRQTIQWSREKDRQYNGQEKKTDNTMVKRKRQTIQWSREKRTNNERPNTTDLLVLEYTNIFLTFETDQFLFLAM